MSCFDRFYNILIGCLRNALVTLAMIVCTDIKNSMIFAVVPADVFSVSLYKGEKAFRDTSGYNLLYSKTAIGSGGVFGKGYKQGSVTQGKFVPEQETDYIFCTVGEEWGFLGSSLLVIFYAVYIGRIYYLAENQKTTFNRVFGYCFAGVLLMHFAINLGMVMGLFPTVGIPLPYFSYGGSSFLAFSIMTAIFFKLNYTDKNSLV